MLGALREAGGRKKKMLLSVHLDQAKWSGKPDR